MKSMLATGAEAGAANPTAAGPTITELPGEGEDADDAATTSKMNEIEPVPRSASTSDSGRDGSEIAGGERLGDGSRAPVPLSAVLQDAAADGEAPVVEHYVSRRVAFPLVEFITTPPLFTYPLSNPAMPALASSA